MKKNEISAFSDKKIEFDQVTGGYYWDQTYAGSSTSATDSILITEKGEDDCSGTGTNAPYRGQDGKCNY